MSGSNPDAPTTEREHAMSENDTHLTEKLDEIVREKGAKIKASIDAHVEKQSGRLDKHVAGAQSRFRKLPGAGSDTTSDRG